MSAVSSHASVPDPSGTPSPADPDTVFGSERARLIGLAYRILGSLSDAEDVVQEAWLRWDRSDTATIDRPAAWLTTVTSRLAIDRLRAVRRRREDYVGPWLPEPIATRHVVSEERTSDPSFAAERAESLELGLLIVLDALSPVERVVFVLADVFAVPFAEIAAAVDRSPEACRQVASRARRKVAQERGGRRPVDEGLLGELVGAIAMGRTDDVVELLAPGVVLTSDGGARRHAARRPVVLPDRVARLLVNLATRMPEGGTVGIEQVNCAPAVVIRGGGETLVLLAECEPLSGAIDRLMVLVNPDKVGGVDRRVELI